MNTDWSISTRPSLAQSALNAISKERWPFLITLMVLLGLSGVIIRRIPFTYSAKAKVLIEYPRSTEQLTGLNNQVELGRLDAVGEKVNPINNQVILLGSYPTFKKALNQLNISEVNFPYINLAVDSLKGTDLIEVSYQSPSPQVAAAITQAIVGVYVQDNLLTNRNKGSSARKFLQMRLPELKNQLKEAQDKLEGFQTQNRFLGTAIETDALTKTLIDLKAQVNTAQVQLAFTAEKVARLKAQLPTDLDASINAAGVSQDIGYQQLQTKLLQAEADLVDLQIRFTNVNPQVVSARNKRDQLKALIQEHSSSLTSGSSVTTTASIDPLRQRLVEQWIGLESERSAQVSQLSKLNQQLRQTQQQSEQLPLLIKQQTRFQMAVEAAQQEYFTFKEKFTTSQIAEQQNISNVRVVESANINFMPVAPNLPLLYAIALVVSTGTSLLVVWLLQRHNDVIDGVLELKETLPIPILATIPWSGDGLLGHKEVMLESSLGHSYQLLQAHIRMLPQNVQVVAVCSGVANEGRSSVATNLATIEAHSGQRVLLIDAHGSCEQTGDRYNGSFGNQKVEQTGDHYLDNGSNREALLNFDILPTGDTPSPFFYKKWLALLEQNRKQYDLIIVDCPPVLDGPDATVLASMCDSVLWVARPQRLGRRSAAACLENLHTWNTRLLGQVVVGAEQQLPLALARDDYFEKSSQPSQLQLLWQQQVER